MLSGAGHITLCRSAIGLFFHFVHFVALGKGLRTLVLTFSIPYEYMFCEIGGDTLLSLLLPAASVAMQPYCYATIQPGLALLSQVSSHTFAMYLWSFHFDGLLRLHVWPRGSWHHFIKPVDLCTADEDRIGKHGFWFLAVCFPMQLWPGFQPLFVFPFCITINIIILLLFLNF